MNELTKGDLIIYEDENDKIEIEAFLYDETIWLPLNKIAELFEKDKSTISEHIKNILEEKELLKDSTVGNFPTVQIEGGRRVNRNIDYYNLDMIIAVGYRTNSKKATKFRQWATEILKSYIIKGYSINKEKLKNPDRYGKDYFDELLEIIKEIRTSERRFYQKVTDLYCNIKKPAKFQFYIRILSVFVTWRRLSDLNWWSGFCRAVPYHLAKAPYLIILYAVKT